MIRNLSWETGSKLVHTPLKLPTLDDSFLLISLLKNGFVSIDEFTIKNLHNNILY